MFKVNKIEEGVCLGGNMYLAGKTEYGKNKIKDILKIINELKDDKDNYVIIERVQEDPYLDFLDNKK